MHKRKCAQAQWASLGNVLVSELGEIVDPIYISPKPGLGQFADWHGLMRPGTDDSFAYDTQAQLSFCYTCFQTRKTKTEIS